MAGKFMRMKIFIAVLVILASAGCASAPANEMSNTPNEVQEISAVSEQDNALTEAGQITDETETVDVEALTEPVNTEQQIADDIDVTLDDLTSYQLELFKVTSTSFIENVKEGTMMVGEMAESHESILDTYIMMNELPKNARQLFNEWKKSVGYYGKLTKWIGGADEVSAEEAIEPNQGAQVQQQKDAQTEISGNTYGISSGETGQGIVLNSKGEIATNVHRAEDEGNSFYGTLVGAIVAREKVSYEKAKAIACKMLAAENGISYEEADALIEDALARDAAYFVSEYGISFEEARARIHTYFNRYDN